MKIFLLSTMLLFGFSLSAVAAELDFNADVAPLLSKYCAGCHDEREANGELVLTTFANAMKGGENGAAIVPGKAADSRLIQLIEGTAEPKMPPEGSEGPTREEIARIRAWIDAGAKAPTAPLIRRLTNVPRIDPEGDVRRSVNAIAHSPDGRWMAIARYGTVELFSAVDQKRVAQLTGMTGSVNDLCFSPQGDWLLAAAGETGFFGELSVFDVRTGETLRRIEGHLDSLYSVAVSPDGTQFATGSYDQSIILWDAKTGEKLRELVGLNGPIYALAYHPTLPVLVSASGDRTVKLWGTATGTRLDTLIEPEREQYALAVTPDGRYIIAGGVDRRIRIWEITSDGREGTNPIRHSRFAHEKAILKLGLSPNGAILVSSGEDHVLKFWETSDFTQTGVISEQSDWATGISFLPTDSKLIVGRMDGSLTAYDVHDEYGRGANRAEPVFLVRAPADSGPVPEAVMNDRDEIEPNDTLATATAIELPATVKGVLKPGDGRSHDDDFYRFPARAGESWVIETNAARQNSPADTLIEVFDAQGEPVLRYLLQAVRESYINFRGLSSDELQVRVKNWEEMGLNQYIYMNGEIGRVIRMPLGPDSGLLLYSVGGKRRAYFDTTAISHPNEETVYIVEAFPPDAALIDNGLPVFPLYYSNDDDGQRKLGKDARLMFTAPSDGDYFVRVRDTRGFGGDEFRYSLILRRPQPDFGVSVGGRGATIHPGGSVKLTFTADRRDDFEGPIEIAVDGLPAGFTISTPVTIEEGHLVADAVLSLDREASPPAKEEWDNVRVTAKAIVRGESVDKPLENLGEIKIGPEPFAILHFTLLDGSGDGTGELDLVPGGRIQARLFVERFGGFDGELRCDVHNLPHGVIVDNIGLSGVMIRAGETEREIFISSDTWVGRLERRIFASATGTHTVKVTDAQTGKEKNENRGINEMSRALNLRVGPAPVEATTNR